MLSKLRSQFGSAGLALSVLAIVFALAGGAFAANHSATASKAGKRGPRGATGKTGPAGPQGPAGANGANGKDGAPGSNGANGKDGVSVTTSVASSAECEFGGVKLSAANGTSKVCNGETGFTEILPSEATETGAWAMFNANASANEAALIPISFNIPLAEAAATYAEGEPGLRNFLGPEEGEGEAQENTAIIPADCKGNAAKPEAAPGNLCIFAAVTVNATTGSPFGILIDPVTFGTAASGTTGELLGVKSEEAGVAAMSGTWAVSAK